MVITHSPFNFPIVGACNKQYHNTIVDCHPEGNLYYRPGQSHIKLKEFAPTFVNVLNIDNLNRLGYREDWSETKEIQNDIWKNTTLTTRWLESSFPFLEGYREFYLQELEPTDETILNVYVKFRKRNPSVWTKVNLISNFVVPRSAASRDNLSWNDDRFWQVMSDLQTAFKEGNLQDAYLYFDLTEDVHTYSLVFDVDYPFYTEDIDYDNTDFHFTGRIDKVSTQTALDFKLFEYTYHNIGKVPDQTKIVATVEKKNAAGTVIDTTEEALFYVDTCPAKYYLMWQDRTGGFLCQPFNGTETFSESFKRNHWATYNNAKRLGSIEVQPQWKLNTNWIEDKYMPYYESLIISPYIELWDTTNNVKYRVYVEDSNFTQKTFKNQSGKMFNLQITVKEDTPQQILY